MHTKLAPWRGLFFIVQVRHARSAHLATLVEALQAHQTTQMSNYTTFAIKRRGGAPRASGSKLEHT